MIFTKLRSTYFHEVDSAAGFKDFNEPAKVRDAASFQRAANKIGYAFNWFYADPEKIAYFNSGANPVRAKRVDHAFPVRARRSTEWKGWDPDRHVARLRLVRPRTRRRSTRSTWCPGTTAGARLRRPGRERVLLGLPLACCSRTR